MRRDSSSRTLLSPRMDSPVLANSSFQRRISASATASRHLGWTDKCHDSRIESGRKCETPSQRRQAFLDDGMNERHQRLLATIAARLDRVRGGMTDTDFAQLVGDVARTAGRFAQIDAGPYRRA